MDTVRKRGEIDSRYRWDLTDLFQDKEEWMDTLHRTQEQVEELAAFQGKDLSSPETLHRFLQLEEQVLRSIENLSTYAHLKTAENTADQEAQALKQKAQRLGAAVNKALSFFEPRIKEMGRDTVEQLVEEHGELEPYRHYFDDVLRTADHLLSAKEESLLGALSDVMYGTAQVYTLLTNTDITFPAVEKPGGETVQLTLNNVTTLLQHENKDFRETVYNQFYNRLKQYEHSVSDMYANTVRTNVKMADLRSYDSALHGSLDGDNIPVTVYDTLLDTVQENLDALHKHLSLKKKHVTGELRMWDLYRSLVDADVELSYDTAKQHVLAAIQPLGDAYVDTAETVFNERWIDVYETKNKRSGAFTSGSYETHAYLSLNWQGTVDALYTLAHELGHAVHRELTTRNQPYIYGRNPIFTAEIASNVNEGLLTDYLLNEVEDDTLQLLALDQFLERARSTLFRQSMFAMFEKKTHEQVEDGAALTPRWLHETYNRLKKLFCKPAAGDELIQYEWMRIPHFYNSFYVYQYATGFAAAAAFAQQVKNQGPDNYLEFLREGGSDYPLNIVKAAGVDLETTEPVEAAVQVYRDRLDTMTEKTG